MTWVIELDAADAAACGTLRHEGAIEACLVEGRLWLRGDSMDEALAARLRRLPARGRHVVTADGSLVDEGARVPHGRLPEGRWLPIHCWLPLEPPPVRSTGTERALAPVGLSLVRADTPREANLLEVPFAAWSRLAAVAPAIRLARWSFAVDACGLALIRGTPLPALPGSMFVEEAGVAVGAGLSWFPPVSPAVLRGLVGATGDDLVMLSEVPGTRHLRSTIIPGDSFVRATRSAVRLTTLSREGRTG